MRVKEFISITRSLVNDRVFAGLMMGLIVLSIVFCVYVGLSVHASDVQVATHYTGFGETNYYRDHWYYLLSFVVFGIFVAVFNTAIAAKLFLLERPTLARAWLVLSISVIVIAAIIVHSILGIAYL